MNGALTEMLFATECLKRGIIPSRPLATTRYDLITEHNGFVYRVQVKKTTCSEVRKSGEVVYRINATVEYSTSEIDFYALLIEDEFYIIPSIVFHKKKDIRIRIHTIHLKYKHGFERLSQ